jgi:aarF domain-containing kinase
VISRPPHPSLRRHLHAGNLIRTPDGRLAILDFGLMTQVDDNIKYGMIEAISHLVHRDYDAIVRDFVTLDFIPPGTDLAPILPVLARVFDQALAGGGAKGINFQELAADLAQITFDYPFRIPPYFALIIRAIGVLEGIALVGDPDFALVDEAFPYISKRLLTDDSPRLREALRYMIYGKNDAFDAERLIDLLDAFETFSEASVSARGDLDLSPVLAPSAGVAAAPPPALAGLLAGLPAALAAPAGLLAAPLLALATLGGAPAPPAAPADARTREALKFLLSPEGAFFREFLLDEVVKSIDALSRDQARALLTTLGLQDAALPLLLPGAARRALPLAPPVSEEDQHLVRNVARVVTFLSGGSPAAAAAAAFSPAVFRDLLPYAPGLATEVLPALTRKLVSRIAARALREVFVSSDEDARSGAAAV